MQLLQLKQQFLEYLEVERYRSAKTIENYDRYLTRFLAFTKTKKLSELKEEQISEFRVHLNQQSGKKVNGRMEPMKYKTQNYYLIALRSFLKFLRQRGIPSICPEQIELAKVTRQLPNLVSRTELDRLLNVLSPTTLKGKRDQAILELLVSTGLRVSELCALEIQDIDFSNDKFIVRGKGDKVRAVFLVNPARRAIKNYLASRQDTEDALFIRYGKKAHVGEDARISPRTVQRLLRYYSVKAGITSKVTPHVIRHSFATSILSLGVDLKSAQALLGHANIGTVQIYTQVNDDSHLDVR